MKYITTLAIALIIGTSVIAQENEPIFKKRNFLFGMGFGTKSHVGNWGITNNFFATKNLNLKLSVGGGQFNYNGFLLSAGPEYCMQISKNKFLLIGSVFTITSSSYDVVDDDLPTERAYLTNSNQYIRSYAGIGLANNGIIFKVEAGYSYALYPPSYTLFDIWTTEQTGAIEKGMNSGLSISLSVQGLFSGK